MPLPTNSLGSFNFRFWLGESPGSIAQSVQALSHPGVDYEGFRWMGLRSGLYQRDSIVDVSSLQAGRTEFNNYTAAIQTGPHKLVWHDYDFDTENKRVVVESVRLVRLVRKLLICYDGDSGNKWDLRVTWNFRLVPNP